MGVRGQFSIGDASGRGVPLHFCKLFTVDGGWSRSWDGERARDVR